MYTKKEYNNYPVKILNSQYMYWDVKNEQWVEGKAVAHILGYKNETKALKEHVDDKDKKTIGQLSHKIEDIGKRIIFINESGIKSLCIKSKMPECATDFAKFLEIEFANNKQQPKEQPKEQLKKQPKKQPKQQPKEQPEQPKQQSKEQRTINRIMKAFANEEQDYQFAIGPYKIDLYFPKYKLAVECDGHNDGNIKREEYLKDRLNCKFIRYNPDHKEFDIFDVINNIHTEMMSFKK